MIPLSRRQVLLAGLGGLVLAACGDDKEKDASASSTSTSAPEVAGGMALRSVFFPTQPTGVDVRLPLAVSSDKGDWDIKLPEELRVRLTPPGGQASDPIAVRRREEGIPIPYFPLRTRFDQPGRWQVAVEVDDVTLRTTVDASPEAPTASVPGPGAALPRVATPTSADARGVDPICTREPACPFHTVTLEEALGGPAPIVLIVSTPKYCATAICGPVLDLVVERQRQLVDAGATVIHAEVYADGEARRLAPLVEALHMPFEPALFLAAPDGTVTDRLDYTFDGSELDESLAELVP